MQTTIKQKQEEIIQLYQEQQWSTKQIANHFNCHPSTVSRLLKKTVGIRSYGMSQEQKGLIYEWYTQGESRREIARRMNTDTSNISRLLLREYGIQPEPKRLQSPYEALIPQFIADYQAGLTASEIARKYQTTHNTVLKHLRQHEQPIRDLEEVKRGADLDVTYFNDLTLEKTFQLGLIWAAGRIKEDELNPILVLSVSPNQHQLLTPLLQGWADETMRRTSYDQQPSKGLKIGSITLCQRLKTFGIRETYPRCLEAGNEAFWKGYLTLKIGFHRKSLYIGFNKGFNESFKVALIEFLIELGISPDSIYRQGQAIQIFQKEEVLKLVAWYPVLLDGLTSDKETPYWEAIRLKLKESTKINQFNNKKIA